MVNAALRAKGMIPSEGDHHIFKKKINGVTEVLTKTSHDNKEISGILAKLMAHQCYLSVSEFWDLVDCTLSQTKWDELIRQRGAGGRNPYFDR